MEERELEQELEQEREQERELEIEQITLRNQGWCHTLSATPKTVFELRQGNLNGK